MNQYTFKLLTVTTHIELVVLLPTALDGNIMLINTQDLDKKDMDTLQCLGTVVKIRCPTGEQIYAIRLIAERLSARRSTRSVSVVRHALLRMRGWGRGACAIARPYGTWITVEATYSEPYSEPWIQAKQRVW